MSRKCGYAGLSVLSLIAKAIRSEISCGNKHSIPGGLVLEFDLLPLINIICCSKTVLIMIG